MAGIKQRPKTHKRTRANNKKSPSQSPSKCVLKPFKYPKTIKDVYFPDPIVPLATARMNRMKAASKVIEQTIQDKRDVQLKDELELWRYIDTGELEFSDSEFSDFEMEHLNVNDEL